jgi:hypothetical protein
MRGASGGCSYRELDVSQHHRLLGLDESDTDGTGVCEREGVRLALRTSLLARSAWWTALDCPVQSKRTGEPEGTIKSWSFNGPPHSPCVTEFSRRGGACVTHGSTAYETTSSIKLVTDLDPSSAHALLGDLTVAAARRRSYRRFSYTVIICLRTGALFFFSRQRRRLAHNDHTVITHCHLAPRQPRHHTFVLSILERSCSS